MGEASQVCPHCMGFMRRVTINNVEHFKCSCGYTVKVGKVVVSIVGSDAVR